MVCCWSFDSSGGGSSRLDAKCIGSNCGWALASAMPIASERALLALSVKFILEVDMFSM
jgi:hypothetical protein